MNTALVLSLIVLMQISIFVHIFFMVGFISKKSNRDFRGFIVTTFTNILTGMVLAVVVMMKPSLVWKLDMDFMLILESGLIFVSLLYVKIRIAVKIFIRSRNPENYHFSYFGKKVYDQALVTQSELAFYYISMPVTLFSGAYFIVNLRTI